MSNTIETREQMGALDPGQWVIAADETVACLFDTHMGFPQRMWGRKPRGGSRGSVVSFVGLDGLPMPLALADVDERNGYTCLHSRANECGQCLRCGLPDVTERRELHFDAEGMAAFRAAGEHNSRIGVGWVR